MRNQPILVIGSTGKTGRRIVSLLKTAGHRVREGARKSPVPFDWEDPQSWAPALEGVSAAYVSYFPDLAFPGAVEKIEMLTEMARAAGVGKMVLLSGRGEAHARACEDIVRRSGLAFTLVRAAWFAQNFSEGYLLPAVLDGIIAMPAGDVREPIADVDDIAEVAVAALTDSRHDGELYEITGPRLLGFAEMAAEITAAAGVPVRYQPITLEEFHAAMIGIGGPVVADVFTEVCRETLGGDNSYLTDGVERALGRKPRDFADFCRDIAARGVWSKAA